MNDEEIESTPWEEERNVKCIIQHQDDYNYSYVIELEPGLTITVDKAMFWVLSVYCSINNEHEKESFGAFIPNYPKITFEYEREGNKFIHDFTLDEKQQ